MVPCAVALLPLLLQKQQQECLRKLRQWLLFLFQSQAPIVVDDGCGACNADDDDDDDQRRRRRRSTE
jgi:hypothetical protein